MPDNDKNKKNSDRKAAEAILRGVDLSTTGGKVVNALNTAEKIPGTKHIIDRGDSLAKDLNKKSGGNFSQEAEKPHNIGAHDKANNVLSGVGGNNKPSRKNFGKSLLKNDANISNPSDDNLNKEKKDKNNNTNNDKLKNQLEKNSIRTATGAINNANRMRDEEEKKNNSNNKTEENNESKDNNDNQENNQENSNDKSSLTGRMSVKTKMILGSVIAFSFLILVLIIGVSSVSTNFMDLVGIGSSGGEADTSLSGDKDIQAMYERILKHQEADKGRGFSYDADLIVAVYHVLTIRKEGFTADDVTDSFISEVVSLMFPDNCGDSCTYSEDTFSNNLTNKFFPKYLPKDECSDATNDVFEYISMYRELIDYHGGDSLGGSSCSEISLSSTSLSKSQFIEKVKAIKNPNSGARVMMQNAEKVYDISVQNNFNPELVVIRAYLEDSPGGSTNNYWGIGCSNTGGGRDCKRYSSLDQGILDYIKTVKGYGVNTLLEVYSVKHYAYVGSFWYSPGSSGQGGCYYYPYIKKYMSSERASQVANYCSRSCAGASCQPTTEEDQLAYSKFQIEKSVIARRDFFGISEDTCEEGGDEVVNGKAKDVVNYAINTFDSYLYSQALRMTNTHVDCSSMVWRSYMHFGIQMGGIPTWAATASGVYYWCQQNGKTIGGDRLAPGDLVFRGSSPSSISHVEMYIGNNQTFGAHTDKYPADRQVSIVPYSRGYYNYYCRPMK